MNYYEYSNLLSHWGLLSCLRLSSPYFAQWSRWVRHGIFPEQYKQCICPSLRDLVTTCTNLTNFTNLIVKWQSAPIPFVSQNFLEVHMMNEQTINDWTKTDPYVMPTTQARKLHNEKCHVDNEKWICNQANGPRTKEQRRMTEFSPVCWSLFLESSIKRWSSHIIFLRLFQN